MGFKDELMEAGRRGLKRGYPYSIEETLREYERGMLKFLEGWEEVVLRKHGSLSRPTANRLGGIVNEDMTILIPKPSRKPNLREAAQRILETVDTQSEAAQALRAALERSE